MNEWLEWLLTHGTVVNRSRSIDDDHRLSVRQSYPDATVIFNWLTALNPADWTCHSARCLPFVNLVCTDVMTCTCYMTYVYTTLLRRLSPTTSGVWRTRIPASAPQGFVGIYGSFNSNVRCIVDRALLEAAAAGCALYHQSRTCHLFRNALPSRKIISRRRFSCCYIPYLFD